MKIYVLCILSCLILSDAVGQSTIRRAGRRTPPAAGPSIKATDDFNRSNEALATSSNWTMVPNGNDLEVKGNQVNGSTNNKEHATYWSADTFTDSQWAWATYNTDAVGPDHAGVAVRCSASDRDYYGFYVTQDGTNTVSWYLFSFTNSGGFVTLASGSSQSCSVGDTLKIMVGDNAATNRVRCKINSTTVSEQDNADHSSGYAGVTAYDFDEDNFIDNFGADDGEPQ